MDGGPLMVPTRAFAKWMLHWRVAGFQRRRLKNWMCPDGWSSSTCSTSASPFSTFRVRTSPVASNHDVDPVSGFCRRRTWLRNEPAAKSKSCSEAEAERVARANRRAGTLRRVMAILYLLGEWSSSIATSYGIHMTTLLSLDRRDPAPLYRQIYASFRARILAGELRAASRCRRRAISRES